MFAPESLRKRIENMICPVHDVHPNVEHDFDGLKIAGCCKAFEQIRLKEAELPSEGCRFHKNGSLD